MKKNIKKNILLILITYMTVLMIIEPQRAINAAEKAIKLCESTVIPSLMPFIFCSNMFIELGAGSVLGSVLSRVSRPLFGVPGSGGIAILLGLVSGYPIGAVCASSLYEKGECTKAEAERLLAFCNNSGPMFVIGTIGLAMARNYKLGIFLYLIHIASAIFTGFIFKYYKRTNKSRSLPPALDSSAISDTVLDFGFVIAKSIDTIIKICALVVLFAVFCELLPVDSPYVYAFFEITGGINEIFKQGGNLPIVSMFLAFSGISVIVQVVSVIAPSGLSVFPYICGKLMQSAIAFVLSLLTNKFMPSITIFNGYTQIIHNTPSFNLSASLIALAIFTTLFALIWFITFLIRSLFKIRFSLRRNDI